MITCEGLISFILILAEIFNGDLNVEEEILLEVIIAVFKFSKDNNPASFTVFH